MHCAEYISRLTSSRDLLPSGISDQTFGESRDQLVNPLDGHRQGKTPPLARRWRDLAVQAAKNQIFI